MGSFNPIMWWFLHLYVNIHDSLATIGDKQ